MSTLEQEILKRLHKLTTDDQHKVLEFMETLHQPPKTSTRVSDLLNLPVSERERLIAQAFELAANEDFETFEAYSEESFDDEP